MIDVSLSSLSDVLHSAVWQIPTLARGPRGENATHPSHKALEGPHACCWAEWAAGGRAGARPWWSGAGPASTEGEVAGPSPAGMLFPLSRRCHCRRWTRPGRLQSVRL